MARKITQRQLRNESGEIMRALDRGESFVVTRNGVEVGELRPISRTHFVTGHTAVGAFRGTEPIELARLRSDLDAAVTQDPTPRA